MDEASVRVHLRLKASVNAVTSKSAGFARPGSQFMVEVYGLILHA